MILRCGADEELDEVATDILLNDRYPKGRIPGRGPGEVKLDYAWLSPDQLKTRADREVLNALGVVGEYRQSGLYRRAYNPLLNRRPGPRYLNRPGMDPWRQLLWEQIDNIWYKAGYWKPQYRGEAMDDGCRFHRRFRP